MELRKATLRDLDAFVENRMEFVKSIREINDMNNFRNSTVAYLEEHIGKEDLSIYIAIDDTKIVSSCMACIFQTVPLPSCPKGKSAELLNVYTLKEYRRKGLAEKLIRMLLCQLKKDGVEKVLLDYTDMGLPLYQKIGFTPLNHQMQLRLSE